MFPVQLFVEFKRGLRGADTYILVQIHREGSAGHSCPNDDTESFELFSPIISSSFFNVSPMVLRRNSHSRILVVLKITVGFLMQAEVPRVGVFSKSSSISEI